MSCGDERCPHGKGQDDEICERCYPPNGIAPPGFLRSIAENTRRRSGEASPDKPVCEVCGEEDSDERVYGKVEVCRSCLVSAEYRIEQLTSILQRFIDGGRLESLLGQCEQAGLTPQRRESAPPGVEQRTHGERDVSLLRTSEGPEAGDARDRGPIRDDRKDVPVQASDVREARGAGDGGRGGVEGGATHRGRSADGREVLESAPNACVDSKEAEYQARFDRGRVHMINSRGEVETPSSSKDTPFLRAIAFAAAEYRDLFTDEKLRRQRHLIDAVDEWRSMFSKDGTPLPSSGKAGEP